MTAENRNSSDNLENKSSYYYANGQRIPLVREPGVFAVRYRAGRDSRDPNLSRRSFRLLHEESQNIGFIPNYGLQLYRTSPAAISRRADPAAQARDVLAEVKNLGAEAPVEYATVAYRRNPETPPTRADDLVFITREFVVQFASGVTRDQIDALNTQYGVRVLKPLDYAANGYLLEAPEAEGERGPVVLSNLYFESGLVKFAHPNFVRRRHLRNGATLTSLAEAEQVLRLARENMARQVGLSPDAIRVIFLEAVEWPDASLGCPQPGRMYPQVITPGYRLILEAGGRRYEYHTDTQDHVVLCHSETERVAAGSSGAATPGPEPAVTAAGDSARAAARAERVDRSMYLPQQWHLHTAKVVDAWNITRGSSHIKVAIIDDGVDTAHQEFSGKIAAQYDFASGSADGSPNSNSDRHGTACAGVAVSRGVRALGAAPDCSLMAVRYPDFLGVAEEADMFRWVADQGADVISCSWGPQDGTGALDPLPDNVRAAINNCVTQGRGGRGIPVFWAAGNGNESVSRDGYASNPDVIAVAASTSNERRSYYSDFGPEIFICAPSSGDSSAGERRIFTADRRGNAGYNPDPQTGVSHPSGDHDYTDDFGGTSSATPLAAGIAGLMLSINPDLRVQDVRQILRETADRIDPSGGNYDSNGHSQFYGYGRVNALRAVERARDGGNGGTPSTGPGGGPSITPPGGTISRDDPPPTFQINRGGRQLYAVEVATAAELFSYDTHSSQRNESNFYGSWQDGLLSSTPYTLSAAVWDRLKHADQLFYRLHVADDSDWTNYAVTVGDSQATSAPSIRITPGFGAPGGADPGTGTPAPGGEPSTGTSRVVSFPSGATFDVVEAPLDGVDYSDHVGNGVVPLIEVRGRMDENLSRNFKVEELAAKDGARYARISVELVEGLQRIRDRVGASVIVNSGYRHPARNSAVGGATNSQHIAGRAADIRTAAMSPLELARIALEELGCDIGIGLGRNVIHVDLRGRLASWTYEGAELSESEFDQWVRDTCQGLGRRRTDRTEYTQAAAAAIAGPERHSAEHEAPTFYVDPGRNNYYAVEVASYPDLFDRQYQAERTPDNFYASWAVEGLREAPGVTTFTLPEDVWERLRGAGRLYYRVVTSSTATGWGNVDGSTPDRQAAEAPWIELFGGRQVREVLPAIERLDLHAARQSDEDLWRG